MAVIFIISVPMSINAHTSGMRPFGIEHYHPIEYMAMYDIENNSSLITALMHFHFRPMMYRLMAGEDVNPHEEFFSFFPALIPFRSYFGVGEVIDYMPELEIIRVIGDYTLRVVQLRTPCQMNERLVSMIPVFYWNNNLPEVPTDRFVFATDNVPFDLVFSLWADNTAMHRRMHRTVPIEGLEGFYTVHHRQASSGILGDDVVREILFVNDDIELYFMIERAVFGLSRIGLYGANSQPFTADTIVDFILGLNFDAFIEAFTAFAQTRQ